MTWRDLLFIFLLLSCFGLGIYLVLYVNSESYKCMNDSARYTIVNLEKANNAKITCTCFSLGKYSNMNFGINSSGLFPMVSENKYEGPKILWNTTLK